MKTKIIAIVCLFLISSFALTVKAEETAVLKGHVQPAGFNMVVRLFEPNSTTEVFTSANSTDADGYFWIYGVPAGTYDVAVKTDNSLAILVANQTFITNQTLEIDFGNLSRGDLDGDDDIDRNDFGIFSNNYPSYGDTYGYPGNWTAPQTTLPTTPEPTPIPIPFYAMFLIIGLMIGILVWKRS